MPMPTLVVKVGGSLYDLPDLALRLRHWLDTLPIVDVVLVPGGGLTTEVVRTFDERFQLGEEKAHWLAMRSLALNAHFLAGLFPGGRVVGWPPTECTGTQWDPAVLDPLAFAFWDHSATCFGSMPHCWDFTSDSIAARVAICAGARHLILLKSTSLPTSIDWTEAARLGFVDRFFPKEIQAAVHSLLVEVVNLRIE